METNVIHCGDCRDALHHIDNQTIDLIMTSPPYANARAEVKIDPDEYVDWIMPKIFELKRVLKPTGSFVLNIKEKVVNGERHTYVLDLIKAMRDDGWLWTEEYCWHKKNSVPGKWPNRFRDSWERCLHFTKQKQFEMHQDSVMVPIGDWAKTRLKNLSATDFGRDESKVGSGFGKRVANWDGRNQVYPSNVLHLAPETSNTGHSAAFPMELPTWFIKLFTSAEGVVLDPFCGSGTTLWAAKILGRRYIGIDIDRLICDLAEKRLERGVA